MVGIFGGVRDLGNGEVEKMSEKPVGGRGWKA